MMISMFANRNKYGNKKVKSVDGILFDSKLEYKHFLDLQFLEKIGAIEDLQRQVTIPLGKNGAVKYRADFVFYDLKLKSWIIWDSKGVLTKEFIVKRAWLLESFKNVIFKQVKAKEIKVFECCGDIDFNFFIQERNIRNVKKRKK